MSKGPTTAALALLLVASLVSADVVEAKAGRWYQVGLESGETSDGYRWRVGVSGPKHEPLRTICNLAATIDPPQDDVPYVEASDLKACGFLKQPEDIAAVSFSIGSGTSRLTILEALYRPVVRKVAFVLNNGERRVYLPEVPRIPNRAARGIPVFRYVVAPFEGVTCIRKVTSFDEGGDVIFNEGRPACPSGTGNV